jgi:NTE family protein
MSARGAAPRRTSRRLLAALPQIRAKLAQLRQARAAAQAAKRNPPPPLPEKCEEPGLIGGLLGKEPKCKPRGD